MKYGMTDNVINFYCVIGYCQSHLTVTLRKNRRYYHVYNIIIVIISGTVKHRIKKRNGKNFFYKLEIKSPKFPPK